MAHCSFKELCTQYRPFKQAGLAMLYLMIKPGSDIAALFVDKGVRARIFKITGCG